MLRMGIVGCGKVSRGHIRGLRAARADVVAGADPDPAQRQTAADAYGLGALYPSLTEMIGAGGLDAVSVCTPNYVHAPLAIEALEAGLHVLCEKPMALNADEGRAMVAAADRAGRLLMMGFNQRFDPGIARMVALQAQGFFGEVYHGRTTQLRQAGVPDGNDHWFTDRCRAGAGVVFDLGSHSIYRAWYAMGKPTPVSISAGMYAMLDSNNLDDFTTALIRFDGGKTLVLETAWAANRPDIGKRTLIMGTKAGAYYHKEEERLTIVQRTADGPRTREEPLDAGQFPDRYQHFVDCLRKGIDCLCPGEDGVVNQAILDAICLSAERGAEAPVRL